MNPCLARRVSATMLDVFFYGLAVGLSTWLVQQLPLGIELLTESPIQITLLLWPILTFSLYEALLLTSPGKQINALALELGPETSNLSGFGRLLLRNLIKAAILSVWMASGIWLAIRIFFETGELWRDRLWLTMTISCFLGGLFLNSGIFKGDDDWQGPSLFDYILRTKVVTLGELRAGKRWISWSGYALAGLALLAIAWPNLIGACACGSAINVKINMRTLQTIVETYSVEWEGKYPPNLDALKSASNLPGQQYWKEIHNPYPIRVKEKNLFWEREVLRENLPGAGYAYFEKGQKIVPGAVEYAVSADQTRYWIYGYTDKGQRIRDKKGVFFLTNS